MIAKATNSKNNASGLFADLRNAETAHTNAP
jgi:hypothetical protein